VIVVAEMDLPRPTAHLTILHIGLDGPASRIDTDRYDLPAVRALHLDLGVPGLRLGGLQQVVGIL
jgi:hypothetical protein